MSITYSYEIISVDASARCMEVVYSAEGHESMHISARLPYEGEEVEDVIRAFAPVPLWLERQLPFIVPVVGSKGVLEPVAEPEPEPEADLALPAEQMPADPV